MRLPPSTKKITTEQLNQAGKGLLPELLGIEVASYADDEMACRMPVSKKLLAPNGYLHAASVVGLADTACGYGTVLNLPEGARGFTTVELKSNFTGTARDGVLVCRAQPVHSGRLTQVWDAVVEHVESVKVIAHFRCTQMILFKAFNDCLK